MVGHLKGLKVSKAVRLPQIRVGHDNQGVITRIYAIVPPTIIKDDLIDPAFLDNFEKAAEEYELKGTAYVSQWEYNGQLYTSLSVNA